MYVTIHVSICVRVDILTQRCIFLICPFLSSEISEYLNFHSFLPPLPPNSTHAHIIGLHFIVYYSPALQSAAEIA